MALTIYDAVVEGLPTTFGNRNGEGIGRHYFVNPTNGNDSNEGLDMEHPLASISQAYTNSSSNNHDVIVLSATSGHAQSTEITISVNRTHLFGLDAVPSRYAGQRSRVTMVPTSASGTIAIVQNTGVGNSFQNIKFDSTDTLSTSLYAFADGGEFTYISDCEFVERGDLGNTSSGIFLNNADTPYYRKCTFGSLQLPHQVTVNRPCMKMNRETITGKVARAQVIEDCLFLISTTSTDAAMIHGTGATDIERFMLLKNCVFINDVLGSANVDQCVEFDSALTEGYVLLTGCAEVGAGSVSLTTGVFIANGGNASADGTTAIQAA